VGTDGSGTPIYLKNVASIQLGPEIRRGVAELDGKGEVAGGIVVVRFGENVLNVIERVKEKIKRDIEPGLPKGVKIVTTYDRSDLIYRSINTLKDAILKLSLTVIIVCVAFLLHLPSALVAILTFPVAILASFICMYYLGVTSNIMSLAGIAIAIGEMVDASIVMVENAHKKLEEWEAQGRPGNRIDVIINAAKEVGPSLFFSLLVIAVAFLPVFALQAQAGMLFRPLAYTKTLAILFSSFLAITLTPALMTLFIRGKIRSEEKNPLSLFLRRIYEPVVKLTLRFKMPTILFAIVVVAITIYPFLKIGREFMPPLYEGSLFYMPVTVPGPSISEVSKVLQIQDKILMKIPEVVQVFGKAGRAETATDPAPLEMFETVINLKPESEWRKGMTVDQLKNEMDEALTIPGVANLFTMPIKARIDMLSTGIRTPVGIKVLGPKIEELEKIGLQIENALRTVPETRTVYAERLTTGYFLDIKVKRMEAARYGLTVDDVQDVIQSTIGGKNITTTVEGRERYPVNVRYSRDFRSNIERMKRVLVPVTVDSSTTQVPLGELAEITITKGPSVIKSDEGTLVSYVYIDYSGKDIGGYIEKGRKKLASLKIPEGYRVEWSGEYEYLVRTEERMKIVIPLVALIIFVLIYLSTTSVTKTFFVLLSIPFSLVGSFWLLYLLNYNMSTASWVGIIALAGISAETGIVMFLFLELAYQKWKDEGRLKTEEDLKEAIMYGAVRRLRPKVMTVATNLGLIPILFSTGTGADVMQRIAAPVIGGLLTSLILVLIIFPVLYMVWRGRELKKIGSHSTSSGRG
jgi:Cu(I)/Ag(I) efflux system membrane protein CusA/SilA